MADDGQLLAYHLVVMVRHQVPVMFRLVNYLDNSFLKIPTIILKKSIN